MKYVFINYPKCSTCQKAKKLLDENEVKYSERHIVTETPTYEELTAIIEASGLPVSKFFNTSGLKYKELKLKEKLPNMTEDEKIELFKHRKEIEESCQ